MIVPARRKLSTAMTRLRRRAERVLYATGRAVCCPYCGWAGWRFLSAGKDRKPNRLCPGCGSLERYRMLALVLERQLRGRRGVRLLELAPKACLRALCARHGWTYISSDLSDPAAMIRADLRAMPVATDTFDAIVCFHVMEHIADDRPAFAEIARILAPGGLAVICVPLGGAHTQEGAPRDQWERLYGRYDHVRLYGMDIAERMTECGLAVETVDSRSYFSEVELRRHGLHGDDRYLFFVRKAAAT